MSLFKKKVELKEISVPSKASHLIDAIVSYKVEYELPVRTIGSIYEFKPAAQFFITAEAAREFADSIQLAYDTLRIQRNPKVSINE